MELKNFDFRQKLMFHPEHLIALRNGKRPFPITCEIDLTNLCNHDCYFCVVKEMREEHKTSLETPVILRAIKQMKSMGMKGISFTGGGEPLVHKDFYSILAYTHDLGIHTGLMTNGALLQKNQELLPHLNWIRISVGAGSRELYQKIQGKDDFDRVIENVYMLGEQRQQSGAVVNIGVRMLLDLDNYHTLPQLAEILRKSKIDYIQAAPDCRDDNYPILQAADYQEVIQETENILRGTNTKLLMAGFTQNQKDRAYPQRCYAHCYQVAITATGNVAFCKNMRGSEEMSIGNIYQNTIEEIWNGERCLELEARLDPQTCHSICKNMQINVAIEDFLNPTNDMSVNFVG